MDNPKAHKQLIHLVERPIRFAYIEELDRKRQDADLIKDFVDGDKLNVEVMYSTSVSKSIQAKLNTCSNYDPNLKNDCGVARRALIQMYESRFVSDPDPTRTHEYPLDVALKTEVQQTPFKLAYLYVLLPFVVRYFQHGLYVPKSVTKHFSQIADEYDAVKSAIYEVCDRTDNAEDRVSKGELLKAVNGGLGKTLSWTGFLPEIKRLRLEYDRGKRAGGQKRVVLGLKWSENCLSKQEL
jgi:phage/plasmid-associated DNA primase